MVEAMATKGYISANQVADEEYNLAQLRKLSRAQMILGLQVLNASGALKDGTRAEEPRPLGRGRGRLRVKRDPVDHVGSKKLEEQVAALHRPRIAHDGFFDLCR